MVDKQDKSQLQSNYSYVAIVVKSSIHELLVTTLTSYINKI